MCEVGAVNHKQPDVQPTEQAIAASPQPGQAPPRLAAAEPILPQSNRPPEPTRAAAQSDTEQTNEIPNTHDPKSVDAVAVVQEEKPAAAPVRVISPAGSIDVEDEPRPAAVVETQRPAEPLQTPPKPAVEKPAAEPPAPDDPAAAKRVKQLEERLQELETKEKEWLQLQSLMTQGISAMVQKEETLRQEIAQRDSAFKAKQGLLTGQLEAQLKESCPKLPVCYARLGRMISCRLATRVSTG